MLLQACSRNFLRRPFRISGYAYTTEAAKAIEQSVEEPAEHTAEHTAEQTTDQLIEKLIYPDRLNTNHHDLQSYLDYASRIGLDPKSTVFVGTRYEYTVQESLKSLGFSLQQTGGASDFGIDLLGEWKLPAVPLTLRVLLQCKALAKKAGPNLVRELEGAFVGAPSGWHGKGVLGLLVTQKPATKGMREALARSRWPMGSIACTSEGRLVQMLWNRRAEEEGLIGVGVGIKYRNGSMDEKEIHLTWKGENMEIET